MDQQRIGQFIQDQRKAHAMTQQELADKLGVTNKAVSKWEKGHSMPDVALLEPLCKELEISIPELLSGRIIDAVDQQKTAEQLLMESISMRKLIGLSVFLQINSIIGVLLVTSPFLFHPERPLNLLLVALGLVEFAMVVFFDSTLPGKEARRQSLTVRFVHTICLFLTIAAIKHPASVREGVPLTTEILVFLIPCLCCLLVHYFLWRRKKKKHI